LIDIFSSSTLPYFIFFFFTPFFRCRFSSLSSSSSFFAAIDAADAFPFDY